MIRLALHTAYLTAVLAIAVLAVYAVGILPIANPATAWAANTAAGCFALLAALTWLPCHCHRKNQP